MLLIFIYHNDIVPGSLDSERESRGEARRERAHASNPDIKKMAKKKRKEKILQLSYNGIYGKMDIIYFGFICPGP